MGLSKRAVLRAGYGAIIAVLVVSAFEAYRIQIGVSQQHLEIYRHYVDEEETLSTLRRNLWLAGNYVRDFFINTTPEQGEVLRSQLEALKSQSSEALDHLERVSSQNSVVPRLRRSMGEFWSVMEPIPQTMLNVPNERQFAVLQKEIVPRRGELSAAVRDIAAADQQRLQESESEFAETRRLAVRRLLLMLALSVLLSFFVARFSLKYAENLERQAERHYDEVEQAKRDLQQLSARLLEVEEEGRRRLSRELHDEIGQTLALLQIEISHAQAMPPDRTAAIRERLQRAQAMAERTVQTVRNISVLLRPTLLDDLGLVPALQFQLEDFLRRSGIACEFVEDGVADALPDAVKTCVYRAVQEALHNCEKHSGASKVRVAVRQIPGFLLVEVEDNGKGFELNKNRMPVRSTGLGLLGIRERTAIVRGTLVIDSAPGRGTRIAIRLPLEPEPPLAQSGERKEVTA
ncbi:MAG TPA: sensor histidine kinase [Bryobacteraceae bacterium]|nr:sensor histidine kinase [Bryobacteraceae bacterium]